MRIELKNVIKKLFIRLSRVYIFAVAFLVMAPIQQIEAANSIGPDDVLLITVYGYHDLTTETRVSADGKISFPLIGEVPVNGKSSIELEEEIAKRLIQGGFIQEAQVNVKVTDHRSQQVSVLGYVSKPGRYALDSDSSVLDVIAMAGGITDQGDNTVVITRATDGKFKKQTLDLRHYMEDLSKVIEPFKMKQNDVVYVAKAPVFYIYGEVTHPGGFRLESDTTVMKALSIGGGLTLRGTENGIIIKRKNNLGIVEEIDAKLTDNVLKNDVIYVSERWF